MKKLFAYFESTDGGMGVYYVQSVDNLPLYGWMRDDKVAHCKAEDEALVEWSRTAEVGDAYDHRLGVCVRLRDNT